MLVPARMSLRERERWARTLSERVLANERRNAGRYGDSELLERARGLSERYLDSRAKPGSVTWSAAQKRRWGSCTPVDATIRLSTRLQSMPDYVIDYVLLHELAHLLEPGHGPKFQALLAAYPKAERARGYLEAMDALGERQP